MQQFCSQCGKSRKEGAHFCPYCGARYAEAATSSPAKPGRLTKKSLVIGSVAGVVVLCLILFGVVFFALNATGNKDGWSLGPARTYNIPQGRNATVTDEPTGYTFRFPDGGSGSFAVADIKSGPAAPGSGQGFWLNYQGATPIELLVKTTEQGPASVFGFGFVPGAYDGSNEDRWLPVPHVANQEGDGYSVFELWPMQEHPGTAQHTGVPLAYRGYGLLMSLRPAPKAPNRPIGFDHYWVTGPRTAGLSQRTKIDFAVKAMIDSFLAALPDPERFNAEERIKGVFKRGYVLIDEGRINYSVAGDDNSYQGFAGKESGPMLSLSDQLADDQISPIAAHELGHYFSHVLMGDKNYNSLEWQSFQWGYRNHGIGIVWPGRTLFLDEPAYFSEWALGAGTFAPTNPANPWPILAVGTKTPTVTDFPSIEGFGALFLISLNRADPQVRLPGLTKSQDAPVVNAPVGEIWAILARGATTVDQLYAHVEDYLRTRGQDDMLPAIAQRIGWSYSVKGHIVDKTGARVDGATLENISLAGGKEYSGGYTNTPTGADGSFQIIGGIFPGKSILRVKKDGKVYGANIRVDYRNPTPQTVDLGDVQIDISKTATPTPAPSPTPRLAATPTTQAAGDWVLQSMIPTPKQGADSACYFDNHVTIGDGSFSSSMSWTDQGCVEGGNATGSVQTTGNWSPPPSYLKAGITLTLKMSLNSSAQQTGGGRNSGGWGMFYMTKDPPKENLAAYQGGKIGDDVKANGWTGDFPVSGTGSGSRQIPDGRKGDTLAIVVSISGPGGSGDFVYLYAFGATNTPPDRPTPQAIGNTPTLEASETPTPEAEQIEATPSSEPHVTASPDDGSDETLPPSDADVTSTPRPGSPLSTPSATPPSTPVAEQQIFVVTSIGVANNGATKATRFLTNRPWLVTRIITYHWNNGHGVTPGTISLRADDGTTYGPWQAKGEPGSGGVPDAYWVVTPNINIPPGAYTVLDSDPSTWSQNEETGGAGMAWGYGIPSETGLKQK
jgi:hypothetical protein